jgi:predicted transport protein
VEALGENPHCGRSAPRGHPSHPAQSEIAGWFPGRVRATLDVERRVLKYYIGYFAGKRSFFTMELQRAKINVYVSLDPAQVKPWNSEAMRDVTKIGHFGLGNTEYALQSPGQLPELETLIKGSYLKNRR